MHCSSVLAFLAVAAIGMVEAQDVEADDVPSQCKSACSSVISSTVNCDQDRSDNEQLNCVCSATNASSAISNCAACISTYGDRDNDAVDLVSKCGFSSTTYSATDMAAMTTSMSVQTTGNQYAAGNYTSPMTSGRSNGTVVTPTGGMMGGAIGTSTLGSGASSSQGINSATGAAAATALPVFGAGAGIALAALGLW